MFNMDFFKMMFFNITLTRDLYNRPTWTPNEILYVTYLY